MGRSVVGGLRAGLRIRFSAIRSHGRHRQSDELHTTARIVIGVYQSTDLEDHEIAELLGIELTKLRDFHAALCLDPVAGKILAEGLSGIYGCWLPAGKVVTCCDCGQRLEYVPCVTCWPDCGAADRTRESERHDMPDCGDTVSCRPGSGEKIEVMRNRVAQGFSPFCSGDHWDLTDKPGSLETSPPVDVRPEDERMFDAFLVKLEKRRRKTPTRMAVA